LPKGLRFESKSDLEKGGRIRKDEGREGGGFVIKAD